MPAPTLTRDRVPEEFWIVPVKVPLSPLAPIGQRRRAGRERVHRSRPVQAVDAWRYARSNPGCALSVTSPATVFPGMALSTPNCSTAGGNGRAAGVGIIGVAQDQSACPGRDQARTGRHAVSQVGNRHADGRCRRGIDRAVGHESNAAVGVGVIAAHGVAQLGTGLQEGNLARIGGGRISRAGY